MRFFQPLTIKMIIRQIFVPYRQTKYRLLRLTTAKVIQRSDKQTEKARRLVLKYIESAGNNINFFQI